MKTSNSRSRRKFVEELRLNKIYAQPGVHEFVVVLDGLKATFNIGKIFRSAQAFGASAVHVVGLKSFNPFPAQGALRYVPVEFYENFQECYEKLSAKGYLFYAFDAGANNQSLEECKFVSKAALIVGHEAFGLSFDTQNYSLINSFRIPMYSSIESLNVSIAASIAMYEYVRQIRHNKTEHLNEQNLSISET